MKNKIISVVLLVLVIGSSVVIHASENVLAITQSIHCPVCLEDKTEDKYPLLPIFQCKGPDGRPFRHFVCPECIETSRYRISACPECRASRISPLTSGQQQILQDLAPEQRALQGRVAALLETLDGVGVDLVGARLIGARLRSARLGGANLTNASLGYANLTFADLSGTNLSNANLREAYLICANLTNANLTNANLTNANCAEANFLGTDLSRVVSLRGARFRKVRGLSPENRAYAVANGAIVED